MKLLKSFGKLYISLLTLQTIGVIALPAISSKSTNEVTTTLGSSATGKPGNSTVTESSDGGKREKCKPNTGSCMEGYSCIRFNSDKENNYTCVKDELAYCESNDYCVSKLGKNYKYCYVPPWITKGDLKQCFTEQNVGGQCRLDIHCVNTLTCKNNRCVSKDYGSLDEENEEEEAGSSNTILGINLYIFIAALAFPALIFVLCLWCWFIGRSSSKHIEDEKKAKYEDELKKMTLPSNNNSNRKTAKTDSIALSEASHQRYTNPQKEIEEEVGKRGFRSLFQKNRGEDSIPKKEPSSVDISTSKVGGKAPINTSTTTDTQQKMKNITNTKKAAGKKSPLPATPTPGTPLAGSSRASSIISFPGSNASSSQTKQSKTRVNKKKPAATTAKKNKKGASSSTGNDTNNSTSSKQSSQRGLVNNASNMSSALSGQSASYFSGASSLDAQSVLYYQQMYNAAAAQAAAQNPYYAQYMQNPYYAAAAAATANAAAYYAQDPNAAAAAMYAANYQNQQGYQ